MDEPWLTEEQAMRVDTATADLRARIAALEAENAALRAKCEAGDALEGSSTLLIAAIQAATHRDEAGKRRIICDTDYEFAGVARLFDKWNKALAAYDAAREGAGNTTTNAAKPQE